MNPYPMNSNKVALVLVMLKSQEVADIVFAFKKHTHEVDHFVSNCLTKKN